MVLVASFALSCGGSTNKHGGGGADGATGGTAEATAGTVAVGASSGAGGVSGQSVGGTAAGLAGMSIGGSAGAAGAAGAMAMGGATSGAGAESVGEGGEAGAPPDTFDATCPMGLPAKRGGCAEGLSCTYGTEPRPWCRPTSRCEEGRWRVERPQCEPLAMCESIARFQAGQPCDAAAHTDACQAETRHLCACRAYPNLPRWECGHDIAFSSCPQQLPENEGQPCRQFDTDYECYYTLCPGTRQPNFVARCTEEGWRYTQKCSLEL